MKKNLFTALSLLLLSSVSALAQSWTVYNSTNSPLDWDDYSHLCIQGSNVWIGHSWGGVAKFDGTSWSVYDDMNSDLVHDFVEDMSVDASGNVWIGTFKGISRVKNGVWTTFDTNNTVMKGMSVTGLEANLATNELWVFTKNNSFDYETISVYNGSTWTNLPALPASLDDHPVTDFGFSGSTTWLAMDGSGIGSYNGSTYTMYPPITSKLWGANDIISDASGNMWMAGWDGIVKYSAGTWNYKSSVDLGFSTEVYCRGLALSGSTLWICSNQGLIEYNTTTNSVVKIYTTANSGLPSNSLGQAAVLNGNVWVTTALGVAKFNPTGSSGTAELSAKTTLNIYPNPAQTVVTISAESDELINSIEVTDMMGKHVSVPVQQQNTHSLQLDISSLATGMYSVKGFSKTKNSNMYAVFNKY